MEYVPGGDLQTFLVRKSAVSEGDSRQITEQVLHGLAAMHREGFAHRDVKPQVRGKNSLGHVMRC